MSALRFAYLSESFYGHAGRAGVRGGSVPRSAIANSVARTTFHDHGASLSTGGRVPTHGYMVALKGHERVVDAPTQEEAQQQIEHYMYDMQVPLRGNYIGTWVEDGKLYLDVAHNLTDRGQALAAGHDNNQIAIYDLGKGETVYTMSDAKRPSESKGSRVRESESTARPRKFFSADTPPAVIAAELFKGKKA